MSLDSFMTIEEINAELKQSALFNNEEFVYQCPIEEHKNSLEANIDKWVEIIQWFKFYPDLWYDAIKPEKGGMSLDFDQRAFLRSMSRFMSVYGTFPRGFGKCVGGNTELFTATGIVPIKELFYNSRSEKEIYTSHNVPLMNRYGNFEMSSKGVISGLQDTIEITTEEGYTLKGTLDHPILVLDSKGEQHYKTLSSVVKGEYAPIRANIDNWGVDMSLSRTQAKRLGKKYGRHKIEFPQSLRRSPRNIVIAFLKEVMSSQNSKNKIKVKSKKDAQLLQIFFLNLGHITSLSKKRKYYVVENKGYAKQDFYNSKIVKIKYGQDIVYDLQMNITHSFIGNGFINHNTMIEMMSIFHTCVFFPKLNYAMSAQTRENATQIATDKYKELTSMFPQLLKEIKFDQKSKDNIKIRFNNDAEFTVLANAQSTKGQRRHRLNISRL